MAELLRLSLDTYSGEIRRRLSGSSRFNLVSINCNNKATVTLIFIFCKNIGNFQE